MANSWQAIQKEFMRRIGEREWPPGELIPSEVDLAEELGCSRMTVNRALRQLAERGFIDRKRKAGSRVLLNPERKATFAIPVIRSEVEAAGSFYSHQLISEKQSTAPRKVAQKMQLSVDSELLHLKTLHYADEQVFAFEDRWLHREAVPEIASVDFGQISCNEWLVANAPFSHGELDIGAHKSSAAEAKLLACEVGEACLETFRLTWAGTQVITYVRLLHAPSRRLKTTL